MMSLTEQFLLH